MRIITNLNDWKPTDLRVEPIGPGQWRVFEPGDTLPVVFRDFAAEAKYLIDTEMSRRFYGGGVFLAPDWVRLITENWIYYLTLKTQGASLPSNTYIERYDGSGRIVTATDATNLVNAIQASYVAHKTAAYNALAAYNANPTTWTLASVVWPATAPGFA